MRRSLVLAALVAPLRGRRGARARDERVPRPAGLRPGGGPVGVATPAAAWSSSSRARSASSSAGSTRSSRPRRSTSASSATLGSPVNPGITTSQDAVFLGASCAARPRRASGRTSAACRRRAAARTPTAYHAFPPGKPTSAHVSQIASGRDDAQHDAPLRGNERLVAATHAIGFFGDTPPRVVARALRHVAQRVRSGARR